jgi:excisionase family DNA binding protein
LELIIGSIKCKRKIMKAIPGNPNLPMDQDVSQVERQTYTIEEAARILGICRAVAYRQGVLPTVRVGGRLLVPRKALERLLAGAA